MSIQGEPDLVVAGSGAAGLVAAVTAAVAGARVLVVERAPFLGGTTALSGGRLWVPVNGREGNEGDTTALARQYLTGVFDERYREMTDAFLSTAPAMTEFIELHTPHRFAGCPSYPDYHLDRPGARRGRCLDMHPLDTADLSPRLAEVRRPPGYLPMTHAEWERWRYPDGYDHELLAHRREHGVLTNGVALVAALLHGALALGVEVCARTRVVDMGRDGGRLRVDLEGPAGRQAMSVAAVVLATGGFEWDGRRRRELLPAPVGGLGSPPSNTGDALGLTERLGAAVDNLGEGWWMPMLAVPGADIDGAQYYAGLVRERGAPRQFVVDTTGRRFVDEALPYHQVGQAMHENGVTEAYLVFDEGFHQRYSLPGVPVGQEVPSWVPRADSLRELADSIGVDADGLAETGDRWNTMAAVGVDDDFNRGGNPYDVYYGDPEIAPNPCMAPLDCPPYYAVRMLSGVIGTKGGPVTDSHGRVLDRGQQPIPGVYAAGNASAFWTADGYPGPGATLGTGMTFGYRAGRCVVDSTVRIGSG